MINLIYCWNKYLLELLSNVPGEVHCSLSDWFHGHYHPFVKPNQRVGFLAGKFQRRVRGEEGGRVSGRGP